MKSLGKEKNDAHNEAQNLAAAQARAEKEAEASVEAAPEAPVEEEKIDFVAARVMRTYREAFEEMAK